jgi:hypothetical protein
LRLVVPKTYRTAVGVGDDALNSYRFAFEEGEKMFSFRRIGKASKEIFDAWSQSLPHSILGRLYGI